jgi:hypothetical protein
MMSITTTHPAVVVYDIKCVTDDVLDTVENIGDDVLSSLGL